MDDNYQTNPMGVKAIQRTASNDDTLKQWCKDNLIEFNDDPDDTIGELWIDETDKNEWTVLNVGDWIVIEQLDKTIVVNDQTFKRRYSR